MALEDITHGLITDRVAHRSQGTDNPIIAPGAIRSSQTHHQRLQVFVDLGAAWGLPLLGTIKLLGNQLPMPRQDRIGLDDCRDLFQRLIAELLTHRSQCLSITVTEPHTAPDLLMEYTIFRDEVFVTQQQLLIDRPCDRGQQLLPPHAFLPRYLWLPHRE